MNKLTSKLKSSLFLLLSIISLNLFADESRQINFKLFDAAKDGNYEEVKKTN